MSGVVVVEDSDAEGEEALSVLLFAGFSVKMDWRESDIVSDEDMLTAGELSDTDIEMGRHVQPSGSERDLIDGREAQVEIMYVLGSKGPSWRFPSPKREQQHNDG